MNRGNDRYRDDRQDDRYRDDRQSDRYRDDRQSDRYRDDRRSNNNYDRNDRQDYHDRQSYNERQDSNGGYGGRGGHGGYRGRGGHGGHEGNRGHDYGFNQLAQEMRQMNVSGRGNSNMYSQNSRGGGSRAYQGSGGFRNTNPAAPAGSAMNLNGPVSKKEQPYNMQKFAPRPDAMIQDRKLGEKMELYTNHVIMQLPETTINLIQYNIDIYNMNKIVNKREEASKLFWQIYNASPSKFPEIQNFIFNDVNILWSTERFPSGGEGKIFSDPNNSRRPRLHFKYTAPLSFGSQGSSVQDSSLISTLVDAIATARTRMPSPNSAYTVFKRMTFLVQDKAVEPSLDDVALYQPFKWGTDARVGFSIAIRMNLRAGPTACFDLNHTLFNRPGYPLVRLLVELCRGDVIDDDEYEESFDELIRHSHIDEKNRERMDKILHKMTLHYSLRPVFSETVAKEKFVPPVTKPGTRPMRTEKDFKYYLLGSSAKDTMFEMHQENGPPRSISIAQYYLEFNNYALRYPHLPVVQRKPSKNSNSTVMYPMELVSYVVNPTRYVGFAPESLRADLVRYTSYTPTQRRMLLQHIIQQKRIAGASPVIDNEDQHMKKFGVSIEKDMLKCTGTLLPVPRLTYGNGCVQDNEHTGEWEAVRNEPMRTVLEEGLLERKNDVGHPRRKRLIGSIILLDSPTHHGAPMDYNSACYHRLMYAIEQSGQPVYWTDKENKIANIHFQVQYRQGVNPAGFIMDAFHHIKNTLPQPAEGEVLVPLVFLIFRTRCSLFQNQRFYNDYNVAKYLGDNFVGIYTQGMLRDNFNKILENPAVCPVTCHMVEKILGKVGTTHRKIDRTSHRAWHALTDPSSPTLVLGIDVSHPKPNDRKENDVNSLSVATVVGNIDLDVTQFRASSRIQDKGEELIVRMDAEVQKRILDFVEHTGKRPAHIVVYRDGICEGDFKKILFEERNTIEEAFKKIYGEFSCTLTYIVVSKRHHTKFFPYMDQTCCDTKQQNVQPGTLVEDVVTTKDYFDFFLTTQVGQMGTSRPTHYYVLHDTWAPMISFWQTITHVLTYSFCRTTSTIALPAPVMYAHLAAKRAKETLNGISVRDYLDNKRVNLNSVEEIARLTKEISVNEIIDGMTFV